MTDWGLFFAKDSEKFFLKIWGEHASAYGLTHFLHRPEAAFIHFRGVEVERLAVGDGEEGVYHFTLHLTIVHITEKVLGLVVSEAEFFACFARQRLLHGFAIVHVAAHSGVPLARLDKLVNGTLLQIDVAIGVEHVQMHHRVKQSAPRMTLLSGGFAYHISLFVNNREYLFLLKVGC